MKKIKKSLTLIIVTCSLFFISASLNAQSFSKYYDHVIKKDRINNELSEWQQTNLIAIFSGNDKGDVILYFSTGNVDRYTKIGKITRGISKDGLKYKYIKTLNERKEPITLQLFDNGVFRVHTQDATYEYQEPTN